MAGFSDLPGATKGGGGGPVQPKLPTPAKSSGGFNTLPGGVQPTGKGHYGGIAGIPGTGGLKHAAGGLLHVVTSALQAPQQAAFRVGSGIGELVAPGGGGIKAAAGEFGHALGELGTAGQMGGDIGFAQATTPVRAREQGLTRKLPTGVETLANIGLDPLLPTAFSKAAKTKEALTAAEKILGAEKAAQIAEHGVGSLSAAEKAALESGVAQKAAEVGATGGRRTLREISEGVAKPKTLGLQQGAERVASKTIGALEAGEAAKPATAIGRLAENLPGATLEKLHIDKGLQALKTSGFGTWAEDALKPRAAIVRDYGQKLGDQVKALGGERLAKVARRTGDIMTETQARLRRLEGEGGRITGEESHLLSAALGGEKGAVDVIKGTRMAELFDHLSSLEGKTKTTFEALHGEKPAVGAAAAVKAPAPVNLLGPKVEGESYARSKLREILARRGTTPEAQAAGTATSATAAAAKTPKALDLDKLAGGPISKDNPIKDVLNRNFKAIHEQESVDYGRKLRAALVDPKTKDALVRQLGKEEDIPEGWVKLRSSTFGKNIVAPESIAKEVDRVGKLLSNDAAVQGFDRFINKFDRFWKSSATSLPVGVGFTARNARSNLYLNWLDGLASVGPYKEAAGIQRKAGQVLKGTKYQDEIVAKGAGAVLKAHLSPREYRIWDLAQKNRVLGANYFDIDLAFSGLAHTESVPGLHEGGRIKGAAGGVLDAGKRMNGAVEDNARLANFIHNLDRFGDAETAAQHVQKYLFDYSELTELEQTRVRKFIPFYTFMRKNMPLQIESLLVQPGKVGARLKIGQALTQPLPSGAPSYLERQQARVLPGPVGKILGGASQVALSPETPLTAALGTLEPITTLAGALPAIARGKAPANLSAEVWRPLVSNLGGGRGSLLKLVTGEAAAKDLFTGAELNPKDTRDRVIKALVPFVQRAQSLRIKTDADRVKYIGSLIQQETKPGETVQQYLLRQAGVKTRTVKK